MCVCASDCACVCVCLFVCMRLLEACVVFAGVRRASAGMLHDSRRVPGVCMRLRKDGFGGKKKKKDQKHS